MQKKIELKSSEKELPKDEKHMHEVILCFEKYIILQISIVWEKSLKFMLNM